MYVIYLLYLLNFLVRNLCIIPVCCYCSKAIQISHGKVWTSNLWNWRRTPLPQFPQIPGVQEMSRWTLPKIEFCRLQRKRTFLWVTDSRMVSLTESVRVLGSVGREAPTPPVCLSARGCTGLRLPPRGPHLTCLLPKISFHYNKECKFPLGAKV